MNLKICPEQPGNELSGNVFKKCELQPKIGYLATMEGRHSIVVEH
jgi:hypothetical protein